MKPTKLNIEILPRSSGKINESHESPQSQIDGETMENGAREGFRLLVISDQDLDFSEHIIKEKNGDEIGDIDIGLFVKNKIDLGTFFPIQFQPMFLDGDVEKESFLLVEVSTTITKDLINRMRRKAFCWWQLYLHFQRCKMHIIYLFNRVEKELWMNIWESFPTWFRKEVTKKDRMIQFSIVWAPHFVVASWPKDIQIKKQESNIENLLKIIENNKKDMNNMKERIYNLEKKI